MKRHKKLYKLNNAFHALLLVVFVLMFLPIIVTAANDVSKPIGNGGGGAGSATGACKADKGVHITCLRTETNSLFRLTFKHFKKGEVDKVWGPIESKDYPTTSDWIANLEKPCTSGSCNFLTYLSKLGVCDSLTDCRNKLTLENYPEGHEITTGYRMVIEPIVSVYRGTGSSATHVIDTTIKEFAKKTSPSRNSCKKNSDKARIYRSDVGYSGTSGATDSCPDIAQEKSGWGFAMVSILGDLLHDCVDYINEGYTAEQIYNVSCCATAYSSGRYTNTELDKFCKKPDNGCTAKVNSGTYTPSQLASMGCCPEAYASNKYNKNTLDTYCNSLTCDYKIDTDIPNNCTVQTNGHIKDLDDWKCIFNSKKSANTNIKTHYIQNELESNRFCDVYCREVIDYNFPNDSMTVYAGRRFTIGATGYFPTLEPVKFKSTTECRTSSDGKTGEIDLTKFTSTWNSANNAVNTAWENYQKAQANLKASKAATSRKSTGNCTKQSCSGSGKSKTCTTVITGSWTKYSYSGSSTYGSYKGSASWAVTSGCKTGNTKKDYEGLVSSAYATYQSALNTRNKVLSELYQCNNFQYTNKNFNPTLKFNYEEVIYKRESALVSELIEEITSNSKYFTSGTATGSNNSPYSTTIWDTGSYKNTASTIISDKEFRGSTSTVSKYNCGSEGSKCSNGSQTYQNNKWVEQVTTKQYGYKLPYAEGSSSNVYSFILKPSGLSVNNKTEVTAHGKFYYSLGYSNFPIHYARLEGKYNYEFIITSFGSNHRFNQYIIDKKTFGSSTFTDDTKYICTYNVKQKIMCNPKTQCCTETCPPPSCDPKTQCCSSDCPKLQGLNIIYRPISLANPFPGYNGNPASATEKERTPGENWDSLELPTKYKINKYITNNRNEKGDLAPNAKMNGIYSKEPMYRIQLSPTLIKQIRKYNAEQNKDSKQLSYYDYNGSAGIISGKAGYSDYNLICNDEGYNCKSTFIWGNITRSSDPMTSGGFSEYFAGCAIGALGKNVDINKCNYYNGINYDSWDD